MHNSMSGKRGHADPTAAQRTRGQGRRHKLEVATPAAFNGTVLVVENRRAGWTNWNLHERTRPGIRHENPM